MLGTSVLPVLFSCTLAPLLVGVINRTKAMVAGRRGQPLLQPYFDLGKLLKKGAVFGDATTWLFRAGPVVGLAAVVAATSIVPLGGLAAPVAFAGDFVFLAYVLGLARFFTVLAALDTGSSFEGMGASREVAIAALAEPALLLALAVVAHKTGFVSLSAMYAAIDSASWGAAAPALALLSAALLVVMLAENSRLPVDDPATHLELTMIHEVMVLDHGGPDLALIEYGSALKLWLFAALTAGLVVPVRSGSALVDAGGALAGILGVGVLVGLVESSLARWRLVRIPQLLAGAGVMAAFAFMLAAR